MTITRDEAEQAAELRGADLERGRILAIIDSTLGEIGSDTAEAGTLARRLLNAQTDVLDEVRKAIAR